MSSPEAFSVAERYGISVRQTGACGDGVSDDAEAIQRALDSGQRLVVIPPGVYKVGRTLRIGSGTRLVAHNRATLILADGAGVDESTYLLSNRDPRGGDCDIEVAGGIWNGNCRFNPRGADEHGAYTGVLVNFINVQGLSLRSMTLIDAESYFLRLGEVRQFLVENIAFESPHLRPNQDGVHLGGFCEDGIIRHICGVGQGTPNDDVVALNADDGIHRAQNLGLKCGPIRRIVVYDIAASDCHTFVRLLSTASEIDHVDVQRVRGGCRVAMLNADACRKCRVPAYDPADPQFHAGVGRIGRVRIGDVDVFKTSPRTAGPLVDLESDAADLLIADFRRDASRDACPAAPTLLVDDVSTRDLELHGLEEAQVRSLRQEALVQPHLAAEARADGLNRYVLKAGLTRASHLELPWGGFDRLHVHGRGRTDAVE